MNISINHFLLTEAQIKIILDACTAYKTELLKNGLGNDQMGISICKGYLNNLEIFHLMQEHPDKIPTLLYVDDMEPVILLEGKKLPLGVCMTIRVALTSPSYEGPKGEDYRSLLTAIFANVPPQR